MSFEVIVWDVDYTLYDRFLEWPRSPYRGLPELMKKILKSGKKNGVISNSAIKIQKPLLENFKVWDFIDKDLFFCYWDEAEDLCEKNFGKNPMGYEFDKCCKEVQKPSKYMFEKLLKNANVNPEECLMVGDSNVDILGAQGVGMKSVYIKGVWGLWKEQSIFDENQKLKYGLTMPYVIHRKDLLEGNIKALEKIIFS